MSLSVPGALAPCEKWEVGYVVFERIWCVWLVYACNQCLCGVWVRPQLEALDMLHPIKGIFSADHLPVLRELWFPPPSKFENSWLVRKIGCSEGGFRSRDERKLAKKIVKYEWRKKWLMNKKWKWLIDARILLSWL
jgi:hypothetical protein